MRERREEKPKQSTNIANNDFIYLLLLLLLFCGEISQLGQKYFQKMKKNNTKIL
jgi:hypothetical protein